jgi:hypothetical protein
METLMFSLVAVASGKTGFLAQQIQSLDHVVEPPKPAE